MKETTWQCVFLCYTSEDRRITKGSSEVANATMWTFNHVFLNNNLKKIYILSSVTWSFNKHANMMICCSRNIYYWIFWWTEISKEQHLFEIEIFCNFINVFTFNFGQFNASLHNKIINYNLSYWPQILDNITVSQLNEFTYLISDLEILHEIFHNTSSFKMVLK